MNAQNLKDSNNNMTHGWVQRLLSHHLSSNMSALDALRSKVLFYIILFFCILAGIAYIPSVYAAYISQFHDIIIVDTFVYLALIFLLFKRNISYILRASTVITTINLLALFLIWRVGLNGAGFLWLGLAPVLSILLLTLKHTIYLWLSYIPILFVLMKTSLTRPSSEVHHFELLWTLNIGNFLLISAIVCISVFVLISGIIHAYKDKDKHIKLLEKTQNATIDMLTNLVEFRDNETGNHIIRTKKYVQALATYLHDNGTYLDELNPKKIDRMYCSAALHDVGKVGVPDNVLLKEGKLTVEEFEIMKQHVDCGYQALRKT